MILPIRASGPDESIFAGRSPAGSAMLRVRAQTAFLVVTGAAFLFRARTAFLFRPRTAFLVVSGALAGAASVPPAFAATDVPRTLDEISIEGEVVMPQVLFITAREPYRFVDTAHRLYLIDAEELREFVPVPFPFWIGRTLAPSVSTVRWDVADPPKDAAGPQSPDGSQGRN